MIYCFYHYVDLDGQCSGAIVKHYFKNTDHKEEIELIPFNYNRSIPYEKFKKEDVVYFVDVAPNPYEELLHLEQMVSKVIIYDHHKSFIESDVGKYFSTKEDSCLQIGLAGCELTWKSLFPDSKMPKCVELLGMYDSWRNQDKEKWDNVILPFQYGMRLENTDPDKNSEFWYFRFMTMFQEKMVNETVEKGNLILKYEKQQNERTMSQSFDYALTIGDETFNCLCVNTGSRSSQAFVSKWDKVKYDFMVAYSQVKDRKWSFSAYTDKENQDASQIAKLFGGGGHKGAAGWYVDELSQFFNFSA